MPPRDTTYNKKALTFLCFYLKKYSLLLLKVNLSLLQCNDGRQRKGLLMAPLLLGGGASSCHTRGFVYFQYGNALSIVSFIH